MKEPTREQQKQLAEGLKRIEYLNSPKGQKELKKAMEKVNLRIDRLNEASRIDWKTMHEPMTI